ncbi:MAG: 3-hydroxyacyl-CoA dehydrogenase NAD-binding domain-containing protein [Gemmatimonadetes bacterium]|nr:3-hydroxyacyl-CoA dehydrogenase NAD-binding domain-containing protein [Gemmatimonadota bacterium]|tara:strand:- start:909 stop:3026 length:2118 start_codon:yes stop_codon:yes gene_type:complete
MPHPVRFDRIEAVGVITLDNPPVNAFSLSQRIGVSEALTAGLQDPDIQAFVICGSGRMFSAGADIREFDTGVAGESPTLMDLISLIEDSPKPVVCALHGTALGGGCELSLACHSRIAIPGTRIGLPEVTLGIVPGAGGTQRLPRLIGVLPALDAIVSGKPMTAEKAHELGLVDGLADDSDDLLKISVSIAHGLSIGPEPPKKTRDRDGHLLEAQNRPELFDEFRSRISRRARGFEAPFACIDCVEAATTMSFENGLAFEREVFLRCRSSNQSLSQRHAFFAEREARKVSGLGPETSQTDVRHAAVLGCGTMGTGIAMCFANAGIPVIVTESEQGMLDRGMKMIRKNYASTVSKGRMTEEEAEARLALIEPTLEFERVSAADVVIEAVFEEMELKKKIFTRLDGLCKADAILATNTSSLDVNTIAAVTGRPEQVVGTHFFSPANVMRLVEIVRGDHTSPEVLATTLTLSKQLGKVGVVVGVCDSFAANRMLYPYSRQAQFLIEEGAFPEQVDKVIYDFGFPMGPFALSDLAGIDVGWRVRQHREPSRPKHLRYSEIADRLYEMGRYGQKTRKGWYNYEEGSRIPMPDPEVVDLVVRTSRELKIDRREISDEEILQRCIYPLINEGARILEEGIVQRASDLDIVWLYGFGFPRYRGGPMFYADSVGLRHVYEVMQGFCEIHEDWLEPAPLLERLAREDKTFAEWDAE